MTRIIDRAADIIRPHIKNAQQEPNYSDCNDDHDIEAATSLQRAGLLDETLPDPTFVPNDSNGASWEVGTFAIFNWENGGENIVIQDSDGLGWTLELDEALQLAAAMKAAVLSAKGYRHD